MKRSKVFDTLAWVFIGLGLLFNLTAFTRAKDIVPTDNCVQIVGYGIMLAVVFIAAGNLERNKEGFSYPDWAYAVAAGKPWPGSNQVDKNLDKVISSQKSKLRKPTKPKK